MLRVALLGYFSAIVYCCTTLALCGEIECLYMFFSSSLS